MERDRVFVVYHFFAHYRSAIVRELIQNGAHTYYFAGDVRDPANSGIKSFEIEEPGRFTVTHSRFIGGRYLLQSGVIRLALRRDIATFIYLGDVQYLTTWVAAALARLTGKRVLFWSHGWTHPESKLRDRIRGSFYKLANGLLLYGHRAREIGIEKGFDPGKLYVIYNSLDYNRQKSLRQAITPEAIARTRSELFEHPSRPMLICSSRLTVERRLELLLEAAAHLRADGLEINILIIGDGPMRASLDAQASQLDLSIKFFGECYDESVLCQLFSAANLTVLPGNAGLSVIHSLAYGTPVITHDNPDGQMPETEAILPGLTGDFFKAGDVADLARVIRQWAVPKSDPVRERCQRVVDLYYNPQVQLRLIDAAVSGMPAETDSWDARQSLVTLSQPVTATH